MHDLSSEGVGMVDFQFIEQCVGTAKQNSDEIHDSNTMTRNS